MIRNAFILLLLLAVSAAGVEKKKKAKLPLLQDGFVLTSVDGKLLARGDKWYFELEEDISDTKVTLAKGTKLQMLESAGLEKMLVYIAQTPEVSFRLFNAMITTYQSRNYIFCDYFVPISESKKTVAETKPEDTDKSTEIKINEPNDTVMIPQDIINRLNTRRIIQPAEIKKGVELKHDSILSGRGGFIKRSGGKMIFVFDSLGRNKAKASLELLPSQSLARAQEKQAKEPEKIRFKVSGIVTKYKGRYYLLLQKVTRSYNYGNFGS